MVCAAPVCLYYLFPALHFYYQIVSERLKILIKSEFNKYKILFPKFFDRSVMLYMCLEFNYILPGDISSAVIV